MYTNRTKYIRLTINFHLTLMMTSAQVIETSVTTTDNSPSQDYTHPDDQTTLLHIFIARFCHLKIPPRIRQELVHKFLSEVKLSSRETVKQHKNLTSVQVLPLSLPTTQLHRNSKSSWEASALCLRQRKPCWNIFRGRNRFLSKWKYINHQWRHRMELSNIWSVIILWNLTDKQCQKLI